MAMFSLLLHAREREAAERGDVLSARLNLKTLTEADGTLSVREIIIPPQTGIPLQSHAGSETIFVLEGELEILRIQDGAPEAVPAGPGALVFIPHCATYGFHNRAHVPARVIVVHENPES
jgi:mannose-6-phosphate isomerase-like protein (cupin superfamily)